MKEGSRITRVAHLGSHLIQERLEELTDENRDETMGELRVRLFEMLKQTIRPEFLNRIDEIIVFKPLTLADIKAVVELQLKSVKKMLLEKNIVLEITDEARSRIATIGYDPAFGARPLKRVIQKYIINGLSAKLLDGSIIDGDTVLVQIDSRGMVEFVTKTKALPVP
jgi:ATP-dependent Clp protease ATP-binding subunit ClpB